MEKAIDSLEQAFTGMGYECDIIDVANRIIDFKTKQMGFILLIGFVLIVFAAYLIKRLEYYQTMNKVYERKNDIESKMANGENDPEACKELCTIKTKLGDYEYKSLESVSIQIILVSIAALGCIVFGMNYFEYKVIPEAALLDYMRFR